MKARPDKTYRVLLADDEPFARRGLKELIDWTACGFEICGEADNGQEALELIGRLQPDVAVVDIRMPVLDGLELIRTVVEERRLPVRFLIASGYGEFGYARQAMRYGVCDFLTKPVDAAELCDALRTVRERLEREIRLPTGGDAHGDADALRWLERLFAASVAGDGRQAVPPEPAPSGMRPVGYAVAERNEPWRTGAAEAAGPVEPAVSAERTKDGFRSAVGRLCGRNVRTICHMPERDRIGFVVETDHLQASGLDWPSFLHALRRALSAEWAAPALVYAGTPAGDAAGLAQSLRAAWTATAWAYAAGDDGVVFGDRPPCAEEDAGARAMRRTAALDDARVREFVEEVETAPDASLPDIVRRLFDDMRRLGLPADAVRRTVERIVQDLASLVEAMGGDAAVLPAVRAALRTERMFRTRADLEAMLVDVARETAGQCRRLRRECGSLRAVRAFVETHYAEHLNLKEISRKFYVNAAHLGRQFKRMYGKCFNDYLFEVRLREAKKLLRRTDLRVYEVAERVGFRNPDYFTARFVQAERMTPTEYRDRFRIS